MAEELNGRVQVASGATRFEKGDVRVRGNVRAECKTTSKSSYTLKLAELKKIQNEAISGGLEVPVMQIEFQGPGGGREVAVLDSRWLLDMILKKEGLVSGFFIHGFWPKGASFLLKVSQLIKMAALKEENKMKHWMMDITLKDVKYSVVSWDLFLRVYEESSQ